MTEKPPDDPNPFLQVSVDQGRGGVRIARKDKPSTALQRRVTRSGGRMAEGSPMRVNWDQLFKGAEDKPEAPVQKNGKPILSSVRYGGRSQADLPERSKRTVLHGTTCPYCGDPFTKALEQHRSKTVDHVWPRSRFPEKCNTFLADVCRRCNGNKGNYTLDEWLAVLTRGGDPRVPYVQKCLENWKL